ncbi:MAG: response regulator transcription factor [Anaerolineae bacterium]|jgi:DNA-binding response OmpR family regulator
MDTETTLLLVDDDEALTKAVQLYLAHAGYEVRTASDGVEGLRKLQTLGPDLMLLDVMMPEMDGFDVLKRAREESMVPIIMLTARGEETDRIRGLRLGADDYIPKPFSLREMQARIEAVLRRASPSVGRELSGNQEVYGDLVIDQDRWEVRLNGEKVDLTPTEARLLFYLAEHAGRILSHNQLLSAVWGPEYVGNTDYTKLLVWRLRQKIEPDPAEPRYIHTERGMGYRFAPR